MKFIIFLPLFIITLLGCQSNKGVELEIINQEVISLKVRPAETLKYFSDSTFRLKSKNIITYKLTNNDDKTYFFNLNWYSHQLKNVNGINIGRAYLNFFDNEHKNVLTYGFSPSKGDTCYDEFTKSQQLTAKELGYKIDGMEKFYYDNNNFILYPGETLYFEAYINLPLGGEFQYYNARFNYKKTYKAEILMCSDSINYKKKLSRTVVRTILKNKFEVYHGIIKSKNNIPVRFIE
ncbi:hypothetical protein FNO01nite_08510 [Flavobacterium noncentrifugens]|uniref:Lipoprotein n=1 Tax=Flavobacterium noncentrifugens TaxID=1128970 RepID=A0A1G8TFF1_9FLAO|nr:hypothetical protein [Flavobacterium noncentrifugens]GEP50179.1 hypothetical protein FNO01nite_08510 [Flavobacterium noncentrifugens]SDJ39410.1 hypothetical protein SAMN04487935_0927 [Flavobacterium noncentrifugens]